MLDKHLYLEWNKSGTRRIVPPARSPHFGYVQQREALAANNPRTL
jgi:hypothetical protein